MPTDIAAGQSITKRDVVHLSALLTIALAIGIYLIATTVVISNDGITFIYYARGLESAATQTMVREGQHPGYPTIVLVAHRVVRFLSDGKSMFIWIYSAQIAALIFRILAVGVLYFIGKGLVGAKFSFWAMLILILLPKPAKYGSDTLSDWPQMFFLAAGMLLLMRAADRGRWRLFGFAGVSAGMGYLVRPECAQIVACGFLWLGQQFLSSRRNSSRPMLVAAMFSLLIGFLLVAGPYMGLKAAVFPKKEIWKFAAYSRPDMTCRWPEQHGLNTAGTVPSDIPRAFDRLFENIGDTFMWFFVPALLIGLGKSFRNVGKYEAGQFFIVVFSGLNVAMMMWLYCHSGYMSVRHSMPLALFTSFYIPAGLHVCASWLQRRPRLQRCRTDFWFIVLASIGIAICIPKLFRPLHHDKLALREAAKWLAENTDEDDLVSVPDPRIGFYAGRVGMYSRNETISLEANYVVKIVKNDEDIRTPEDPPPGKRVFSSPSADGKHIINIYVVRHR